MSNYIVCTFLMLINVLFCECSNIFHESSRIVYRPDASADYFGYSVILSEQRLIVGAPKATIRLSRRISSGQVFKCPIHDLDDNHNVTCIPIGAAQEFEDRLFARAVEARDDLFKDDIWFGATLSTTPSGALFVCAPRWTKRYRDTHLLQNGMCYMLSARMGTEYIPLLDPSRQAFLSDDRRPEYGEFGTNLNYYAYGQAGFSMKVSETNVILGAPGLLQWTGGVVEYRPIDKNFRNSYLSRQTTVNTYFTKDVGPDDYLGYSVESGVFERNGTTLIVAGAPRSHYGYGQVLIFEPSIRENSPLNIKYKVIGAQLGSYFGATLSCADVNGDGIVDLLVGAPNYVRKDGILHYDQGAVFVYLTKQVIGAQLGSYFGATLSCADVNGDGIVDLLVGAPNYVRKDGILVAILHYDQGAVFVYLTKQGYFNFTLEAAGYVSGAEVSGARFGSSIADLGDVDGDGYNDIAIGAPWEDDGKGAVYVYRGGEKGLHKHHVQRVTVAESRTFGYSISKGVDIDDNNCSDLAVGAYSIGAAYIFRCLPTVYVNVSIKVPDAMNLPLNATNFTAQFCVSTTPRTVIDRGATSDWIKKIYFTARVAIDPKENRASLNGDTEYNLAVTAGNENCDEQIVMVKPTADLSKPISIKFNLEEIGSIQWEDSPKFPMYGARLSADSILETSFDIQLRRDCGEDLICKPWLQMSLEPLHSTYVPGTNDSLGFKVTVFNKEEPAYGAKVYLTLPSSPKRLPSDCSLEELEVTCHLPAPLSRSESIEWEFELEYTFRDSDARELNVVANLEDPFYEGTDIDRKRKDLVISVTPQAKFAVSGKALPNATVAVTRDKFNERDNVTFVHFYEVTNYGPSDWFRLPVQIVLPEKGNLSNGVKGCLSLGHELECSYDLPAQVSLPIIIPQRFDLSLHGKLLEGNGALNITTTIVIILDGMETKTASVITTLILEPAPPIWPYIVGGVAGILLLSVLILVFYKYGFFSRNRPGNFKKLQEHEETSTSGTNLEETRSSAEEASTCGTDEPSFIHETSSQELLTEDTP